jgi:hypothetical protein
VTNPIKAIKGFGVGFVVGKVLKAAAEGQLGSLPKWVYWHLKGLKTVFGVVLGVVAGTVFVLDHYGVCAVALQHWAWFDCAVWSAAIVKWTASASAFFLWIGQVDGSLHLDAPDLTLDEALASFRK